ncbi:UDP-glycosyltransferase 73C4-like [Panicum virgatum]|nr:UDP-glycosyltransferase 73C4-like [Panicum virgatum]
MIPSYLSQEESKLLHRSQRVIPEMERTMKPHLVLIPWIGGISHIIPMTDIGCLLASHGAAVTILTTPANAPLVRSRVDRAALPHGGTGITVTAIPFPAADAGLPEGCERLDLLRSPADVPRFFTANKRFGEAVARYCRGDGGASSLPCRPTCIVAGMGHPWTLGLARELGVPCYIFHGFGAFALLCIEHLFKHRPHEAVASPDELFDIPVLPPFECRVSRRQLPPHFLPSTSMGGGPLKQEMREFDVAVDGVVVNTFEELEHGSTALLAAAAGKKVLAVGPVSLSHSPSLDAQTMSDDAWRCMAWLDTKAYKSVVYASFGSAGCMPAAQLVQLGMALVSCPWPVLWVVKGADSLPDDAKKWLRENTDADGVAGTKCLVVRGWAPQVPILAHPAVGGFLTHCGWGSTLEAVAAGMPMATWPLFAEQFVNERLIVDVLGVGVSVGVTKPTENMLTASKTYGSEAEVEAEVGMEQVTEALERLMDQGAEGEERRRKAQELKLKAKGALEKGGSSYVNLENLIHSLV